MSLGIQKNHKDHLEAVLLIGTTNQGSNLSRNHPVLIAMMGSLGTMSNYITSILPGKIVRESIIWANATPFFPKPTQDLADQPDITLTETSTSVNQLNLTTAMNDTVESSTNHRQISSESHSPQRDSFDVVQKELNHIKKEISGVENNSHKFNLSIRVQDDSNQRFQDLEESTNNKAQVANDLDEDIRYADTPFNPKPSRGKAVRPYFNVVIGGELIHSFVNTRSTNTFMGANGLSIIEARNNKWNLNKRGAVMMADDTL